MIGGRGFIFVQIHNKEQNKDNFGPEWIDIWFKSSFGRGDSNLFLGSCMAAPQGLKLLHSDIWVNIYKIFFSRTLLLKNCCTNWDDL